MPSELIDHIGRRIRLLAILIVTVLLAAAVTATASQRQAPQRTHYLGMRQLQLAALTGHARIFLRATGITPDSPGPGHSTDLPVESISWGISNPATVGTGSGGLGSGRPSVSSFNLMRPVDKFSPKLMADSFAGAHLTTVTVYVLPAASAPAATAEQITYTMSPVLVESIQQSAAAADGAPTESVSLAFEKMQVTYLRGTKTVSTATLDQATQTP
jgi:type VI secretion system secreted protein Hcp